MSKQKSKPLTKFEKIFMWYMLAAIIVAAVGFADSFRTGLGMFIVMIGIFGLLAGILKRKSKKDMRITVAVIGLLLFMVGGSILPEAALVNKQAKTYDASTVAKETGQSDPIKIQTIEPAKLLYKVTSITDGDTIKVNIDGKTETIRMIGLDTPETKDPRKPVQCFGKEASSRMQHYVQSKTVVLEKDNSQGDRDSYGRLLRYVLLEDGTNVALKMIDEGYAHEYTYNKPYKYQVQFKAAEASARANAVGFWSPNTCNGDTTQAVTAPKVEAKAVTPAPTPTPAPQPTYTAPTPTYTAPVAGPSYANCTEVRNAGAAPIYPGQPGFRQSFDRDNDGIGCE